MEASRFLFRTRVTVSTLHPSSATSVGRHGFKVPGVGWVQWLDQLTSAVNELHAAGIVWGDVKPENVLVDGQDNVWIIKFGGGYTPGWFDKEVAENRRGDLAGIVKLREFITRTTTYQVGSKSSEL